ncbi:hypothetical protein CEXT_283471 [Caerostris extrusa]|uniref:Uncharacterized protein n=1 Tax=Caerostris extrusa TaxID=172846 RepID=A0AAV4VXX7_CAEEX|nr:hypothetical protein CEXT_283471 [Caerostris extrusa]
MGRCLSGDMKMEPSRIQLSHLLELGDVLDFSEDGSSVESTFDHLAKRRVFLWREELVFGARKRVMARNPSAMLLKRNLLLTLSSFNVFQ